MLNSRPGFSPFVQRIADILSHIADERNQLFTRLQRIAEITKLPENH